MGTLSEIHAFNRATLLVQSARSIDDLTQQLLAALRALMPGDACLVNWFGLPAKPVVTFYEPAALIDSEINRHAHLFLHQHPSYGRRFGATSSISDHLSQAEWRRTDMYAQTYARVGLEDGLGLDFDFGGGRMLTLEIDRSRRGFSGNERVLLDLFRDHVRLAYERLMPELDVTPTGGATRMRAALRVSRAARILDARDAARGILERFFGREAAVSSQLPEGLARWFHHTLAAMNEPDAPRTAPAVFKLGRADRVLSIHCGTAEAQDGAITLTLEETIHDRKAQAARTLSVREREVLHWLAQGKANAEIGIILGVSPGTIKRHLENIYAKLNVENRQAAIVASLRGGLAAG